MQEKKLLEYTEEEILAFGVAAPDESVDFSTVGGFFRVANSLTFLPTTQVRVQMLLGLLSTLRFM